MVSLLALSSVSSGLNNKGGNVVAIVLNVPSLNFLEARDLF